ncbi:reverse transcriptase-like protein [Elysia marginata]|uniref:Reverse transcriptase-like protein n=1 Tax=Elysia marginata TaxID=1093978 RepID=A0AAV4FQL0_9GAST|nr:reverse transcriptase-like protein [Elysia marginata]
MFIRTLCDPVVLPQLNQSRGAIPYLPAVNSFQLKTPQNANSIVICERPGRQEGHKLPWLAQPLSLSVPVGGERLGEPSSWQATLVVGAKFSTTKTCKKLFSQTDQLLGKTKHKLNGDKEPCNKFSTFFDSKITKIREELEFQQTNNPLPDPSFEGKKLEHFTAITETLVEKTIRTFASKSCDLDPIPTDLLKKCVKNPCVLSYITSIFNQFLQSGAVPEEIKKALVNPMLKKPNLDESDSKNFRPVSNLPFLLKVLEKLVAQQLLAHLDKYGLKNRFQSAYRSNHSTETALIKVSNDLLRMADKKSICPLALLDLSAAFDTIDHNILFSRLHNMYGISGMGFDSYLSNRFQAVKCSFETSDWTVLKFGVPQGPLPFSDSIKRKVIKNQRIYASMFKGRLPPLQKTLAPRGAKQEAGTEVRWEEEEEDRDLFCTDVLGPL